MRKLKYIELGKVLMLSACLFFLLISCWMFTRQIYFEDNGVVEKREDDCVMTFEVCGGLTNQRIALIQGILLAVRLNRKIVLPNLKTSYKIDNFDYVRFSEVYDIEYLRQELKDLVQIIEMTDIKATESWFSIQIYNRGYSSSQWKIKLKDNKLIRADCAFNSVSILNDPYDRNLLWRINDALKFSSKYNKVASAILDEMPKEYIALHYRVENDWVEHCKVWTGGLNCFTNTDQVSNVLKINRSPQLPVYVAGSLMDDHLERLKPLKERHELITKHSFKSLLDEHFGPDELNDKFRDLIAIVDFLVCMNSTIFYGNSVSTFSAFIELSRLSQGMESHHYNGHSLIPLADYIPPQLIFKQARRLRWVFTMILGTNEIMGTHQSIFDHNIADAKYVESMKVAVYSARKHTSMEIICIAVVDSILSRAAQEIIEWLQAYDVTFITHIPKWARKIVGMYYNGLFQQNVGYSSLYTSPVSLISNLMRIDIPTLGFVDDFVLYTDVDVIFLRDLSIDDFNVRPQYYLAACKDCSNKYSRVLIDAGVMLYNILGMYWTYDAFLDHIFSEDSIRKGLYFGQYGYGADGAYNSFYDVALQPNKRVIVNKYDKTLHRMNQDVQVYASFNYRPYWKNAPIDGKAVSIIHWQGPTPDEYEQYRASNKNENMDSKSRDFFRTHCDLSNFQDSCWVFSQFWLQLRDEMRKDNIGQSIEYTLYF